MKHWFVRNRFSLAALAVMGFFFWIALPNPLFTDPFSTVLLDRNGKLLGARVAGDGQWRFPVSDSIPQKFETALLAFEDAYFYYHPGVNPVSIAKAARENIEAGGFERGGSTLSMQLARLSRKGKPRTIWQKLVEVFLAIRMEFSFSKEEILQLYCTHAPFGGNVVGLEAASWRYYGRPPETLSWAECAALAVLPNAPSLIHPGRNRELLLAKRDFLLEKLAEAGAMDTVDLSLAKMEPLPKEPRPIPSFAPHLMAYVQQQDPGKHRIQTTIDKNLHLRILEMAQNYSAGLAGNEINNLAVLVADARTGEVLSYIGNTSADHSKFVDIVQAPRSSGSILKPFLYANAFGEGMLNPRMLISDIPMHFGGFFPVNFDKGYDGMVRAGNALSRSLNIPAVSLLRDYGAGRFHQDLKDIGFTTLQRPTDHYGLTLILGGGETTLWETVQAYGRLAQGLKPDTQGFALKTRPGEVSGKIYRMAAGPGAIFDVFQAMTMAERPYGERHWQQFAGSRKVAWKTGTSFGHRDAWAVGITPEYIVGVWAGNADGTGRPGLTGVWAAAPFMFRAFSALPATSWFEKPAFDQREVTLCAESGMLPSENCPEVEKVVLAASALKSGTCPYHQKVWLDAQGNRVHVNCTDSEAAREEVFFVLPPAQAHFYGQGHFDYRPLPPMSVNCAQGGEQVLALVYPGSGTVVSLPRSLNGEREHMVLEAAYNMKGSTLYWHLDEKFLGTTTARHKLACKPAVGRHVLLVVDEYGNNAECRFTVR